MELAGPATSTAPSAATPAAGWLAMNEQSRIALLGGIYSNYLALEAAIADAKERRVEAIYCLGDLGAFGPYPDRIFPLLHEHRIRCLRGNYDDSIGSELADCQCGY